MAHAINGFVHLIRTQRNARIHALATVCVTFTGLFLGIKSGDWIILIMAMSMVWLAEALNTALEMLADAVAPDYHPLIGHAKDVAAAAVLLAAVGAALIGGLVFGPFLIRGPA